jgi:hypothetical protein
MACLQLERENADDGALSSSTALATPSCFLELLPRTSDLIVKQPHLVTSSYPVIMLQPFASCFMFETLASTLTIR